jgi:AmmeMemoRadiSam system radical SAM enzyme/AmmeMemoRadiSam system protein B/AmmeMemoRadiSam system protein A
MSEITVLPPESTASADCLKPAGWWHESQDRKSIVCDLCPRGCSLAEGKRGFCFVRQNLQGRMISTTYGRSTGFCIDPIEKKPLNHFYPGSAVLSFGTAGCNLGCKFCQNWESSKSREVDAQGELADPETVARAAKELGCRSVAFTYNDPVVWAEYAIDCARACRAAGVKTVAVTAGYITPLARKAFFEVMDAANVDLKGFSDDFYRELTSARLAPVQDTLQWLVRESDVWLEVTNLIIPGKNDSEDELKRMCGWFLETLGPDVPLHFTAFHPDFRMRDIPPTPPDTLIKAREIARSAGLNYVYTGNVSDRARQSTYCPGCKQVVVSRDGYYLNAYNLQQNRCRGCGAMIAGRFADGPGAWGPRRQPVRIADYHRAPSSLAFAERSDTADFGLTTEQERLIFRVAARRFVAEVSGQSPASVEQSLAGLAAKVVAGAFVTVRRSGALRSCCGSFGQAMPLWRAIEHAAVAAAKHDRRFPPISPLELPHLDLDVTLLDMIEPIAARGADRRKAVVVGKHGLKITRGGNQGLLLPAVAVEHGLNAERFLQEVCRKAGLPANAWQADDAVLARFQGQTIKGQLKTLLEPSDSLPFPAGPMASLFNMVTVSSPEGIAVTNVAKPQGGLAVRPPAVAGMFYPRSAAEIDRALDEWFDNKPEPEAWAGAMVPHAGWIYSGRLAADVFRRVKFPQRVIILAPKHRPAGAAWAVAPYAAWQVPGACLESDPELAGALARSITGMELNAAAHAEEHAIEVQLPFIARLAPKARVVGITVHGGPLEILQRFGEQLAGAIAGLSERPLLVISSDMNHYADDAETRRRDRLALDALATLDPARLYRTVHDNRISMCGVAPAVVALTALRCLNALNHCCEVGYTTSAAAAQDTRRCVGYAGMLFR